MKKKYVASFGRFRDNWIRIKNKKPRWHAEVMANFIDKVTEEKTRGYSIDY